MWLDIVLAVIFILCVIQGWRKGFIRSFSHVLGWVLAIVLGFVWQDEMAALLKEKTRLYDRLFANLDIKFSEKSDSAMSAFDGLPEFLQKPLGSVADAAVDSLTTGVAGVLFNIISFLIIVILIKIVIALLVVLLSKKNHKGIIGFVDGFFGLLMGIVKGIVIVYILLALMVPVMNLSNGDILRDGLDRSTVAIALYENNPILRIVNGIVDEPEEGEEPELPKLTLPQLLQ